MRVAVYARYSSDLQDACSIVDQLALACEHAERQGWQVVAKFSDAAISGASLHNRPGLSDLMRAAESRHFEAVLTESLDRLSRDLEDIAGLYKRLAYWGVDVMTLADGKVSKLHVGLKGMIASLFLDDLAQKTRRGQIGRVKAGRIPGGRCYGYSLLTDGDERGRRSINEAEAAVVRRIFADYARGRSPLKIVQELNAEGIPGPRGGYWNASALLGSAKRRNGLLNNSLYRGQITYNRQRFVKGPSTGKRQAQANPADQWVTKDVPELAIVPADLFDAALARRAVPRGTNANFHRRAKHLLSGLIVCGSCGSRMIVRTRKGGIIYFGCSARMNRLGCTNARNIAAPEIENRVLASLRKHLLAPDVIATAIDAYRSERRRLSQQRDKSRNSMERDLGELTRKIKRIVHAIADGQAEGKEIIQSLNQLERQREALEASLGGKAVFDSVEFHPRAADRYRQKVQDIQGALAAGDAAAAEAVTLVRDLIQRVKITPTPRGEPVAMEIAGDLAALLNMDEGGTPVMSTMVAGARNPRELTLACQI
jgi:DNA invertase Pin-like site-specific DNA recombinase